MISITQHQQLIIKKGLSFRGIVKESELDAIKKDMDNLLDKETIKSEEKFITATFGVDGEFIDIEIIIPIEGDMSEESNKYQIKNNIVIKDAILASYTGNAMEFANACREVNEYILKENLKPTTVGYNVFKRTTYDYLHRSTNVDVDIYIGVCKE